MTRASNHMGFLFRKISLLFGDVTLLYGSLILALATRFWGVFDTALFWQHAFPFSFLYLVWLTVFYVMDLYDLSLPPTSVPFLSRFAIALCALTVTGVLFFYALSFSAIAPKTNLVIHVLVFGTLAYAWRLLFSAKISPLAHWKIGLYGLGEFEEPLKKIVSSHKHHGYGCIVLEDGKSLAGQIKEHRPHVVISSVSSLTHDDQLRSLYDCLGMGVTFLDVAQAYELFARRIPLTTVDQQWFIRNLQEKERGLYRRLKRLVDIGFSLMILIMTSPFWLLFALAIKIEDGGNVFYTQGRVGRHGKIFLIKKFRTMKSDAEVSGAQWAQQDDPRVTRVGRLLRATHLDELPQMLNVLKGDISLVGPRPERPEFVRTLQQQIPHYHVRHFITPGFTGWAQIKFRYARSVLDSQKKFEYDLYYMKNKSLILDVLILLKTTQMLVRRDQ